MNTHLPPQWEQRLLAVVNGHGWMTGTFYPEGLRLLSAWQKAEGGTAQWNPLNTTLHLLGATSYNNSDVQNYLRPVDGICATAMTLANGLYNGILGALQGGTATAEQIVEMHGDEFSKWGTNPLTILAVLKS